MRIAAAALAASLLAAGPALAPARAEAPPLFPDTQPEPRKGTLWVDVGGDTTDVLDARVELDVPATERALLRLGAGGTYIPTLSANVEAGYVLAGAVVDTSRQTHVGGSYEYWGQEDILTTHTLSGSFTWRGRRASFSVLPQARRIVLFRQLVRTGRASEESNGHGLDLLGTLYGPGGWEWTVGAAGWRYTGSTETLEVRTVDTRTLDTRVVDVQGSAVQVDTRALLAPAAGFLERRLSGEVAYAFGDVRLGAGGSVTHYVADDRPTYGASGSVYLPAGRRRAIELRAGRLFGGDLGPVTYGRIAIGYGW